VLNGKNRYTVGLEKLDKAASQIAVMREEIEYLQPFLMVSAANIKELMVTVEKESAEAAIVSSDSRRFPRFHIYSPDCKISHDCTFSHRSLKLYRQLL
jgi:hypothetical protein